MIRRGTDADGPGCRALIAACWGEYTPAFVNVEAEIPEIGVLATSLAARGGALWVAEAGGAVVGMAGTFPAEYGWHLARMYVTPGERGTGLARALAVAAEDHARAAGGTRMVLWSDVLFERAHAFYEKCGYVRRGGLRALGNAAGSIEAGFAKPLAGRVVEALDVAAAESAERPLAAMLQAACAAEGVPGLFLPPLERAVAATYWRDVTRAVGQGRAALFAAWRNGVLAGTVQLWLDMPETGRHRAVLRGLVVAPGLRCRGLARRLLDAAAMTAREAGRTLLVTEAAVDAHSDALWREAGWAEAGVVPGFLQGAGRPAVGMRVLFKAV